MNAPLKIEFHHAAPIQQAEIRARQELAELERFCHRIVSCRIDVEVPEHPRRGSVSKVKIDLGVPGARGIDHLKLAAQHKDVAMAIHAAFNAAHRRLQDSGAR